MYYFFIISLFLINITDTYARNALDSVLTLGDILSNISFARNESGQKTKNASIDTDFLEETEYKNAIAPDVYKDSKTELTTKTQKKTFKISTNNEKDSSNCKRCTLLHGQEIETPEDNTNEPISNTISENLLPEYDEEKSCEFCECNHQSFYLESAAENIPCQFCGCQQNYYGKDNDNESIDDEDIDEAMSILDEDIESDDEDGEFDDGLNEYTENQDDDNLEIDNEGNDDQMFEDDIDDSMDYGGDDGSIDYGGDDGSIDYGGDDESMDYGSDDESMDYGSDDGSIDYGGDDGSMDYGSDDGSMDYGSDDGSMGYGGDDGSIDYGGDDGSIDYGGDDGSMGYGGDDGSIDYGGDDGSMDYGSDDGSMGNFNGDNNSIDLNYDNSSMINNNGTGMNNDISNNMPLGTDQNTVMPEAVVRDNNSSMLQSNIPPINTTNQLISEDKPPLNDTAQNNIENSRNDTPHEESPEQTEPEKPENEKISDATEGVSSNTTISLEESDHATAEIESPREKLESPMAAKIIEEETITSKTTVPGFDKKSPTTGKTHKSQLEQPIQIDTVNVNNRTATINQAPGSLRNSTPISSDTMLETDIANGDISFDEFSQTTSSTDQHKYDGKLTSEDF